MLTCYIVDDEYHAIESLTDIILNTPGLELLGSTDKPLSALEVINSQQAPDLTFVDIDMPQISGIEFAGLINMYSTVIFTTAYPNFSLEAYDKQGFDYLLKPITYERFLKCINRYKAIKSTANASNVLASNDDYFYIKSEVKGKLVRVNYDSITYIEAALNYVIIHMDDDKNHMTYLTMGEISSQLPQDRFIRVHKSFIVNRDKIKAVGGNNIFMDEHLILTLGKAYRDEFYDNLNKKVIKTKRG
ncbi:response regulator transcription factor [Mucilaginibacter sp. 21P]|uniref:LytR/AlgR family response regulator transcription factor n=1 Tax=Mucilaginibacter sp. 21P TaxID=2778902 RepID=UPI001C58905A|nr:LytTR family DNA-binding domain-containing protein [Mucilaginibacter sp. 21P]QXV63906.1 response regulator transcription factor [Mucilaginibacter sp. 21P]